MQILNKHIFFELKTQYLLSTFFPVLYPKFSFGPFRISWSKKTKFLSRLVKKMKYLEGKKTTLVLF